MSNFTGTIVKILAAIVVVAIVAALMSKKSQTSNVISSAGSLFDWLVKQVVTPITGTSTGSLYNGGSASTLNGLSSFGSLSNY